jgi:hypothetical protein
VIAVSNTSTLLNLALIDSHSLLEKLYENVLIPSAVLQELAAIASNRPTLPDLKILPWLASRAPTNTALVALLRSELDPGEAEAIALAAEIGPDILLLDERRARKVAARMGLKVIGLLGVVLEAKRKGFIRRVQPLLDEVVAKAGFWVSARLYARVLEEAGE